MAAGQHFFRVHGLTLVAPFALPLPETSPTEEPDVRIVEGEVARSLDVIVASDDQWQAAPGSYLLKAGPKAGRILVEGGKLVTLRRGAEAEPERIAFHITHSVMAAVLRQRGRLVLHASAA